MSSAPLTELHTCSNSKANPTRYSHTDIEAFDTAAEVLSVASLLFGPSHQLSSLNSLTSAVCCPQILLLDLGLTRLGSQCDEIMIRAAMGDNVCQPLDP